MGNPTSLPGKIHFFRLWKWVAQDFFKFIFMSWPVWHQQQKPIICEAMLNEAHPTLFKGDGTRESSMAGLRVTGVIFGGWISIHYSWTNLTQTHTEKKNTHKGRMNSFSHTWKFLMKYLRKYHNSFSLLINAIIKWYLLDNQPDN